MILRIISSIRKDNSALRSAFGVLSCTLSFAVFTLLVGCAISTAERKSTMLSEGAAHGFVPVRYGIEGIAPPLVGMLRMEKSALDVLWVVIEGDGRAWLGIREPSQDPTPVDAVGWRLAKNVSGNAVLYLARPCQFLSPVELQACSVADWTDARFAEKWVARLNVAIDETMERTQAKHVVLTGYSGGGVMAALIAARRNDVSELMTIAAPLDHAAWTTLHGVTPLTQSLSVLAVRETLFRLPQVHIVGAEDNVVPPAVLQDFLRAYPADASAKLIILPGIDHRMQMTIDLARVGTADLSK